mgnify:CR=1 FL=1
MSDIFIPSKNTIKNQNYKEIKKPNFWTESEDKILKEKAKEFNYKNWNSISKFIPGRTPVQCSARFRRIKPGLIKGAWGKEEDIKLLSLYDKYGKNWAAISKEMPHRTGKQIRDRFLNNLDTKYERGKFTKEEDKMILKYYKLFGNSWAKIAKKIKTRTGDMIKNRFYSSLKKEVLNNKDLLLLKRKRCTSKNKNKLINSKNDSKIIIKKKYNEIDNDINDIKDKKDEKKYDFINQNKLNNSHSPEEYMENINHNYEVNNINSTNIMSNDSINYNPNMYKYIDEDNNSLKINKEKNPNEFNENLNSYQLFIDNENKFKYVNNNNNNDDYYYLNENLNKKEIINNFDYNDNFFNTKYFLELKEIDNENVNFFSNKKYDKNLEYGFDLKPILKEQMNIIFDYSKNIINE